MSAMNLRTKPGNTIVSRYHNADAKREAAKQKAKNEEARLSICYQANESDSKYSCPSCERIEAGTLRIITHKSDCENKGKEYCQQQARFKGGRKNRMKTKKARRIRSRTAKYRI
jgi:hypothetical protein